jgi:hypothetical protein
MQKWTAGLAIVIGTMALSTAAQTTNTFPPNGNVGIGTTSPEIHSAHA